MFFLKMTKNIQKQCLAYNHLGSSLWQWRRQQRRQSFFECCALNFWHWKVILTWSQLTQARRRVRLTKEVLGSQWQQSAGVAQGRLCPKRNFVAKRGQVIILWKVPTVYIHFSGSQSDVSSRCGNTHFMKKLPVGAEASNVLVGEVDFLSHHVTAFVRLKNSSILGDLTEVPVPTRFLFILLGPTGHAAQFKEIGRAIATLMSDEVRRYIL